MTLAYAKRQGPMLTPTLRRVMRGLSRAQVVAVAMIGLGFVLVGALVELAGLVVGAVAWRVVPTRPALLRAAVLAQAADLVTFAFIWRSGGGERNPLALAALEAAHAVLPAGLEVLAAALFLLLLKLALIVYLVRVATFLGRYRDAVLIIATAVGLVGATTNVLAL